MDSAVPFTEQNTCDQCGAFGAFAFDGRKLCGDCYATCGSCCPGHGDADKPSAPPEPG